ncbi:MAG TPA: NADH-quinone oxidoreductase subunit NuoG [Terriglobales bacterium]|nr:NADH-quinone oxidoreductase subunit NuoG [Terriglobales bacterium]
MATIYIDDRPFAADATQNLLHVCLSLGFNLPYFCWHPALGSVGACRQCAVKQFRNPEDKHGKLVMACMTPAAEGTRISIEDAEAVAFRAGIIEGMMQNHPHDCPVCDEGGECHLQDMTVMTGHDYRRYNFRKRTFRNQYLGPFVNHEMNRCIQCYRCVRFYREYAGGRDFNVFGIRNLAYFGREQDGVLESEFAGNLDEVCPTGVFTDATHKRHYTRKWDLQFSPSVCVHCGLGCNISPGERYGTLRRIVNRYHGDINGYFLCDRGRYGYEFVNSEARIRHPELKRDGQAQVGCKEDAVRHLGALLANGSKLGIGSPRASLEANFSLRAAVGSERFYAGIPQSELSLLQELIAILRNTPGVLASLQQVESSDAVLVLGEDVPNYAPRMALSLRQAVRQQPMQETDRLKIPRWLDHAVREAVQDRQGPLFIATPVETRLDDVATEIYHAAPDDIARLGFAVAHAADGKAPAVEGLSQELASLAQRIAESLRAAERPLVISGLGCRSQAVLLAAANVVRALDQTGRPVRMAFTVPDCNSIGLALLSARGLEEAFSVLREDGADTAIVLENDLFRHAPASEVRAATGKVRHLVALDHLRHATTASAELAVPVATFAEADGTLINNEGRAQRFFQTFVPAGEVEESWRWIRDAGIAAGRREFESWSSLDDVITAMIAEFPELASIAQAAPLSGFRMAGEKIPRQPHRYSGRTAMLANINVSEPKPPADPDSPLAFSMEGTPDQPPAALIPFSWSPGWNSYQAINKFQEEIAGSLRGGNPGVHAIQPSTQNGNYFSEIPPGFRPRRGEWLLVPLYHVFGSEELSSHAPGVKQLSPDPYLALHPDDAKAVGFRAGTSVRLTIARKSYSLPLSLRPDLPRGVAGVPWGVAPLQGLPLPDWGRIEADS